MGEKNKDQKDNQEMKQALMLNVKKESEEEVHIITSPPKVQATTLLLKLLSTVLHFQEHPRVSIESLLLVSNKVIPFLEGNCFEL